MSDSTAYQLRDLDRPAQDATDFATQRKSVRGTESGEYRPAIDGLRAVAVLAVVVFHLHREWLPGGFVGVDIFFVISGYLITSILVKTFGRSGLSLGRFYQRRIARLLPAFATMAVATLVGACWIYSKQDLASAGATASAAALSIANLKFMLQGNYFVLSPDAQPFLHCWSLSVEEQFYLVFPVLLFVVCASTKKHRSAILMALWCASLLASIILTTKRPEWAFFLFPTRAWELLSGSIVAVSGGRFSPGRATLGWLSVIGLTLIALSFAVVHEGAEFPGWIALLPVLGTVGVIGPMGEASGAAERLLSLRPMVIVGRMSYSLYLWHWPVFSLVDYGLYLSSPSARVVLKLFITALSTSLCYFFIEKPGRLFLNRFENRKLTFGVLCCFLGLIVPAGTMLRRANYINADLREVRGGGLVFNQPAPKGSMILMGDSFGSMYGKLAKEVASKLDLKLTVISVAAGDPLPRSSGPSPELWVDSLAIIKKERPDFLILVCNWDGQLRDDKTRLNVALDEVKPFARSIILLTQPPKLPPNATRESIRDGSRPPFVEDVSERRERQKVNSLVRMQNVGQVQVIDVGSLFSGPGGTIRFFDDVGQQCYHDVSHLSFAGTNLVRPLLLAALSPHRAGS